MTSEESEFVLLYSLWLRANGLKHSDQNLQRFIVYLASSRAAERSTQQPGVGAVRQVTSSGESHDLGPKSNSWFTWGVLVLVGVIIAATWGIITTIQKTNRDTVTTSDTYNSGFSEPQVPMPSHGESSCQSPWMAPAELVVEVPGGSNTYYVEIVSAFGSEVCHAIIGPGRSLTLGMPTGTYYLKYAAGTRWYGYSYLFGPNGSYARASESFPFSTGDSWEVELIRQVGGNLGTSGVDYYDF